MSESRGAPVDVLVIGAGPAGLSAAAAAAECGKRVLVLDQSLRPGGQIWRHRDEATLPAPARVLLERVRLAGVTLAAGARVIDVLSPHELVVDFRGRVDRQHTRALVLATGARERFIPFPGWTLPGVVGIGGLQALLKSGLSLAGARVVIGGTGPLLFPVAAAAVAAGAELLLVAEQAPLGRMLAFALRLLAKPSTIDQAVGYRWAFRKTPLHTGSWITAVEGHGRVQRAIVQDRGRSVAIDCAWVATSAGLLPNTELAQLLGCEIDGERIRVDARQACTIPGVWAAGECTGIKGDRAAMAEGTIAGLAAVGNPTGAGSGSLQHHRAAGLAFGRQLDRTFALRPELLGLARADTMLCRCEDVRRGDIDPAWTQRQAKLWTRVGMGECQGAICGPACAALFGWKQNASRPPVGAPLCGPWGQALGHEERE